METISQPLSENKPRLSPVRIALFCFTLINILIYALAYYQAHLDTSTCKGNLCGMANFGATMIALFSAPVAIIIQLIILFFKPVKYNLLYALVVIVANIILFFGIGIFR